MKTIRIGKEYYRIDDSKPGREAEVLAAVAKARKVPTPAQFRAWVASRKDARYYPVFTPGMSTKRYVTEFYGLNAEAFKGWTQDRLRKADGAELVANFFEPLSTRPMFAPSGEVIEETLSQPA